MRYLVDEWIMDTNKVSNVLFNVARNVSGSHCSSGLAPRSFGAKI